MSISTILADLEAAWPRLAKEVAWPGEEEALELVIHDYEVGRQNVKAMRAWLKRAKEIINSAYCCPEWLLAHRSERTDETERIIREYLEEFGEDDL